MLCFCPEWFLGLLYLSVVGETRKKDRNFEKEFIY
jgi:hypothetical protein